MLLIYAILPDEIKELSILVLGAFLLTWSIISYNVEQVHFYGAVKLTPETDPWLYWMEVGWRFVVGIFFICTGIKNIFS